jgi:signal transduction histidine kinase
LILLARDNGQGILPANRDKIFTPFFTTSRNNGGTGLGLEICRSILRAHGARIDLHDPQPETGAVFRLEFPARGHERPDAKHDSP